MTPFLASILFRNEFELFTPHAIKLPFTSQKHLRVIIETKMWCSITSRLTNGVHSTFPPGLKHYAGTVQYDADCFLEKNRDTLADQLITCCKTSTNSLVADVFNATISDTGALMSAAAAISSNRSARASGPRGMGARKTSVIGKKSPTISAQFTTSLTILIKKMLACDAHFVRCIKPNTTQSPNDFVPEFVNDQLR